MNSAAIYQQLGFDHSAFQGDALTVHAPRDGVQLASLAVTSPARTDAAIRRGHAAFAAWRQVPAPLRGELVRLLGDVLRRERDRLGQLVTLESGKIATEGLG